MQSTSGTAFDGVSVANAVVLFQKTGSAERGNRRSLTVHRKGPAVTTMQVGQKVVCLDDVFPAWARQVYTALPVKGVTYTIREVSPGRGLFAVIGPDGKPIPGEAGERSPEIRVLVVELVNPPDPLCAERELGFRSDRFAPIEEAEAEESEPALESVGAGVSTETWRN